MADIKDIDIEKVGHKERAKIFLDEARKIREKNLALNITVKDTSQISAQKIAESAMEQEKKGNQEMADFLYKQAEEAELKIKDESYVAININGTNQKLMDRIVGEITAHADEQGGKLDFPAHVMDLKDVAGKESYRFFFGGLYKFTD